MRRVKAFMLEMRKARRYLRLGDCHSKGECWGDVKAATVAIAQGRCCSIPSKADSAFA